MVAQSTHKIDSEDSDNEPDDKLCRRNRLTQFKAPLWKLCKEGGRSNIPYIKAALAIGEDANSKDETSNTTALMLALTQNQNSMAKLLLGQPSLDINCRNDLGETALHCAVDVGNIQGVRLLLSDSRLTTFNDENDHGNTPAMMAINRNEIGALKRWQGGFL